MEVNSVVSSSYMVYETTVSLPATEVKRINRYLSSATYVDEFDKDAIIDRLSLEVPNTNYWVDIKVCNGDSPYIDAILFDGGVEVDVLDVRYFFDEVYQFIDGSNFIKVNIVSLAVK